MSTIHATLSGGGFWEINAENSWGETREPAICARELQETWKQMSLQRFFRAIYLFQRLSEEKHKITLLQDHYYDPEANTVLGNPSFRAKIAAGCFGRMPSPALMEGSLSDAQCGSVVRLENIFLSPSWLRVWYVIHNI